MIQAGSASAAHCAKDGSPGFSYFGQEGRLEADNVGGPGANECPANTGSPSVRAPGQNNAVTLVLLIVSTSGARPFQGGRRSSVLNVNTQQRIG